jgi:hypothetical protein
MLNRKETRLLKQVELALRTPAYFIKRIRYIFTGITLLVATLPVSHPSMLEGAKRVFILAMIANVGYLIFLELLVKPDSKLHFLKRYLS